jgi:hypothetical protein
MRIHAVARAFTPEYIIRPARLSEFYSDIIRSIKKGPREMFVGNRLLSGNGTGVDGHLGVANDLLDLSLLLKISEGPAGQAAVDLQTVDKGGDGDQAVGLDILLESLGSLLLKDDGVLGLVLDYTVKSSQHSFSLRPQASLNPTSDNLFFPTRKERMWYVHFQVKR